MYLPLGKYSANTKRPGLHTAGAQFRTYKPKTKRKTSCSIQPSRSYNTRVITTKGMSYTCPDVHADFKVDIMCKEILMQSEERPVDPLLSRSDNRHLLT